MKDLLIPAHAGRGAMAHVVRDVLGGPVDHREHAATVVEAMADGAVNVVNAADIAQLARSFAHAMRVRCAEPETQRLADSLSAQASDLGGRVFDLSLALHRAVELAHVRGVLPLTHDNLEQRLTLNCHHEPSRDASARALEALGVVRASDLPANQLREALATVIEAQCGVGHHEIFSAEDRCGNWIDNTRLGVDTLELLED